MNKKNSVLGLLFSLIVSLNAFAADEIAPQDDAQTNKVKFAGGLGLGYNTYNSTLVSISQYSLVAKFGMNYRNKKFERLSLNLNSFFTALPFNTSLIQIGAISDNVSVRYLGVNLRAGYDTPWLTGDWKLQLNLGWYYNTTFVTNDRFGYVNANGPQFFPAVSYTIDENSSVGGYLKFSPMSTGFSFLNSSMNYEVAAGAYYMFPGLLFGKFKHTLNLDFAHLSIKPDAVRAFSNSTTIGLGVLL